MGSTEKVNKRQKWEEKKKLYIRLNWTCTLLVNEECHFLVYVKLSTILEFIGKCVLDSCNLGSVFIPLTCREIGNHAFAGNRNLTIFAITLFILQHSQATQT